MIIDAHCHAGPATLGPWPPEATFRRHLARSAAAGIARTVVFPGLARDYSAGNRAVADLVRRHPGRFIGFAFVDPVGDRGRIAALLARTVAGWGCRGVKIHWVNGTVTPEVGAAAVRLGLPVLHHPRGDLTVVRRAAEEFPDVAWIVPHLATFGDDARVQGRFIDLLARHPNLFTDTSGVRYFDLLQEAVRRAGPHKVLFGTDGPYLHPAVELAKVDALALTAEGRRLVLGGNVQRLLRPVRPALRARRDGVPSATAARPGS